MAKQRIINTRFWTDNYVSNLDPVEKLLFLYFLTNPATNISGTYEVPLKNIALDTGLDKEMVEKIIKRFSKENKIYYYEGWVHVVNFIKHQNQGSPKVKRGIELEKMAIPQHIIEHIDTLSKGIDTLSHSNTNSNTNSNLTKLNTGGVKPRKETQFSQLGLEIIKEFESIDQKNKKYYNNTTQRAAADFLVETYGLEEVKKRISVLPKTNKVPYFPTITTPVQLRDKWVQLEDAVARKREELKEKNKVLIV